MKGVEGSVDMRARRAGSTGGGAPSGVRPQGGVAALTALLALLTLLSPIAAAAPAGPSHPSSSDGVSPFSASVGHSSSTAGAWRSFDTGNVTLTFSAEAPAVTLSQDANPSVRTTLAFEHILEVSDGRGPSGDHGPMGLLERAFALPSGFAPWTARVSGEIATPAGVWVNFTSNVTVMALATTGLAGVPLWQTGSGEIPSLDVGARVGTVNVIVSFHLSGDGTPGHEGLAKIGVEFSGWPWADPLDSLALEWQFFAPGNGTVNVGCASLAVPANGSVGSSPCASEIGLGVGEPIWSNSTTAVEAVALGGLVSYANWSNTGTATSSSGVSGSVALGAALFPVAGGTLLRLLQTLPLGMGSVAKFSEDPTIGLTPLPLPPLLSHLPPVVQGDLATFVVSAVAAAAGVLAVQTVRRRHDEKALERF